MKNLLPLALLFSLPLSWGCRSTTGRTAEQNIDDAAITSNVKAKLAAEEGMSTLTRVGVKTVGATVYLTGAVRTQEEKSRAEQLAGGVSGVKKVVNELEVRP